ncbi:MAG: ribosome biogenesis GTPase YlqF [Clostridiales bacterium]|jgi:ribosome biogenesis GTPase A|nr:ribosome biogenesis GTPase YlqF [Clostridiales bacterium]
MENITTIQWFPGHMSKTRRMIKSNLSAVDAVVEILDARIPMSSQNPEMESLIGEKPRMLILNKKDMADDTITDKWIGYFKSKGILAIALDCKNGKGVNAFLPAIKNQLLRDLVQRRKEKGMVGRPIRVMIVGIPNVGKSSFINRMAKSKRTKVEDRPGVTRTKQWVSLGESVEMLDMPGVLWPKFEDQSVALNLAFTGAIKDDVIDIESVSMKLLEALSGKYPKLLVERYKIEIDNGDDGKVLLEKVGRKRGMLLPGGIVNTERAAITVLDEFRCAKLGRISLEFPPSGDSNEE